MIINIPIKNSTSLSLQGDYAICQTDNEENLEPVPIKIVHGYSKDRRPDLKQFLINLIASGDGGVPLFLSCGSGNDNDKAKFAMVLSNFKNPVDFDSIFVADSALYSAENLLKSEHLKWITRVPLSIKAAQFYVRETPDSEFIETALEGYKAVEKAHRPRRGCLGGHSLASYADAGFLRFLGVRTEQAESNYGGIKQKWIIVESETRKASDLKQLSQKIAKDGEKARLLVKNFSQRTYENRTEIKAVFQCEQKKLKYHHLVLKDVSKTTDQKTKNPVYKATIILEKKSEKIEEEEKKAGRFILATNVLENLSPSEILTAYKGQQFSYF